MGHHITGLVAHRDVIRRFDGPFARQPCFSLTEGMAFMPLDDENLDGIVGHHEGTAVANFTYLTERLIEILRLLSRNGAIAYVETEYFGGTGGQGAAVFRDGEVISRPDWRERGTINFALSKIGVTQRVDQVYAFDAVGLGAFRSNEKYREKGTAV